MKGSAGGPPECDVFISFSMADIEMARELAAMVREMGHQPYMFADRNRDPAGARWTKDLQLALTEAKVLVCIVSADSMDSKWVEMELTLANNRKLDLIPLVRAHSVPSQESLWLFAVDTLKNVGEDLRSEYAYISDRIQLSLDSYYEFQKRKEESNLPVRVASEPVRLIGKSIGAEPYPGPRPFNEDQQAIFYGREFDAGKITRLMSDRDVLILYGSSGVGKSSLLNAKVAPLIRKGQKKQVLLNGRSGLAIRVKLYSLPKEMEDRQNRFVYSVIRCLGGDELMATQATLAEFIRHLPATPDAQGRVLVLDQFEEIFFDSYRQTEEQQFEFIKSLNTAIVESKQPGAVRLQLILSLRKEYLADAQRLLKFWRSDLGVGNYPLEPISDENVREVITAPVRNYLRFDEDVIESLIHHLREVRIKREDGNFETHVSSAIEMAHLQIVCRRLWEGLPTGATQVTAADVDRAAGEGKSIEDFVGDALNAFYEHEVQGAAERHRIPRHVIELGCQKFVSPQGNRMTLHSSLGRVGRLTNAVADELAGRYLLRKDGQFYELSHDLLVGPVRSSRDREGKAAELLFATDLLERLLQKALAEHGWVLRGYFGDEMNLLKQCAVLAKHTALFDEELELLLRISLRTGEAIAAWCERAKVDAPYMLAAVVEEALGKDDRLIRRNAIKAVCRTSLEHFMPEVIRMSLHDPDRSVKAKAVSEIFLADKRHAMEHLVHELRQRTNSEAALHALAQLKRHSAESNRDDSFQSIFNGLYSSERRRIRTLSWQKRLAYNWWVIGMIFVGTVLFVVPPAFLYKMLPASLNWGVSQHEASPFIGAFQGLVAGVLWAGLTALSISFYYYVFGNEKRRGSALETFWVVLFGLVGASLASCLISAAILGVFHEKSLLEMGWLCPNSSGKPPSTYVYEAFFVTGFGFVNIVTGAALGIGISLVVQATKKDPKWDRIFRVPDSRVENIRQLWDLVKSISHLVLPKMPLMLLTCLLGAVTAYTVPEISPLAKTKANPVSLIQGLVGDVSTQIVGAYFGIIGMFVAMVVARHGFELDPSRLAQEDALVYENRAAGDA